MVPGTVCLAPVARRVPPAEGSGVPLVPPSRPSRSTNRRRMGRAKTAKPDISHVTTSRKTTRRHPPQRFRLAGHAGAQQRPESSLSTACLALHPQACLVPTEQTSSGRRPSTAAYSTHRGAGTIVTAATLRSSLTRPTDARPLLHDAARRPLRSSADRSSTRPCRSRPSPSRGTPETLGAGLRATRAREATADAEWTTCGSAPATARTA
jgi:hypothetical protein